MAINVHGHHDGRVPALFLDVGQGLAILEQEAGEGVPESVMRRMPAFANAVSRAIGVRVTSLPITAEKVFFALQTGNWPV